MANFNKELLRKAQELKKEQQSLLAQIRERKQRLATVSGAISGIEQLLVLEGVELSAPDQQSQPTKGNGRSDIFLPELLKKALADKAFHATEDLAASVEAMGYDFEGKNPLRSVNFTLMGLRRGGGFERRADGHWRYFGNDGG